MLVILDWGMHMEIISALWIKMMRLYQRPGYRALKKLKETGADCCLWSSNHRFPDGSQSENVRIVEEAVYERNELRQALLDQYLQKDEEEKVFHIPGYVWSGIYNLKFLTMNKIHFFSFVDCEDDCIFMNQVICFAEKLAQIPEVGYLWSCNPKSESHRSRYICNYWEKVQKLDQWFRENIYDIFSDSRPPEEKTQKELAIHLYTCVENECSLQNSASFLEISEWLKEFLEIKNIISASREKKGLMVGQECAAG